MLGRKKKTARSPIVDIHSHLIPGIDDGSASIEDSIAMIQGLIELGYTKAITTPHIHPHYPNNSHEIHGGLELVQKELEEREIDFELGAAAEYYVDEIFMSKVKSGHEILTFADQYVLVESSFLNKPLIFENCLFELQSKGYHPVLAHPERYRFLEGDLDWLFRLKEMGVRFQVTISSFAGFYGAKPKLIAKELFKKKMIDFLGSDLHAKSHIKYLHEGLKTKQVSQLCEVDQLMNQVLV